MKTKYWLPFLALYLLYSLFFIDNISIDSNASMLSQCHDQNESINDLREDLSFVDLDDFESFLFGFGKQPFYKKNEAYLDTTGDGVEELVRETVLMNGNICEINQEIFKEGKLIWENSFHLNSSHLETYFGNNIATADIEPYALFYLGLTFSPFIDKMTMNTTSDDRNKRMIRNYFKDSELSLSEMYHSNMGKSIKNYNGYFIFKRNDGYNSIYMWNENEQKFTEIHDNNNFPA